MEKNKFISFVIPAYNAENFLELCIQSIVKNIGEYSYEILIIDNDSTDRTADVARQLENENIHLMSCKKRGVSYARNMGLENAVAKFIMFIDADDIVDHEIKEALKTVSNNQEIDIFQFSYKLVKNNREKRFQINSKKYHNKPMSQGSDIFYNTINERIVNSLCLKIFRRDFIIENNLRLKQFSNAEDMEFVARAMLVCKNYYVSDIAFYHYIVHENSAMTNQNLSKLIDAIEACKEAFAGLEKYPDVKRKKYIHNFISKTAYFTLSRYAFLSKNEKIEFEQYVRNNIKVFAKPSTLVNRFIRFFLMVFGARFTLKVVEFLKKN